MVADPSRILIMELWGIGDVVMMSAVLAPLRQAFPDAEICVLCQEHGRDVLRENREITKFFVFRFPWTAFRGKYCFWRWDWKGILRFIASLRREKFDLVLDARGDPRNDFLSWLIAPRRHIRRHISQGHRISHWAGVLREIGMPAAGLKPLLALSFDESSLAEKFLANKFPARQRVLAGIHPGAAQKMRCWPLARFEALAAGLKARGGVSVLILADPDGYGKDIAERLGLPWFQGSIRHLAAVLSRLDLLVCNDTGVMHIADALGVPLVAVFGPGDPGLIGPQDGSGIVIKACRYRPCFDDCRQQQASACLERISVEEVKTAVEQQIMRAQGL